MALLVFAGLFGSASALPPDDQICRQRGLVSGQCPTWTARSEERPTRGVDSALSADGARLYVIGGGGRTVAFHTASGVALWTTSAPEGADAPALALGADGTTLYIVAEVSRAGASRADYYTAALDAGTGATLWSVREVLPTTDRPSALVLAGARVVVTGTAGTIAYDAASGARVWSNARPASVLTAGDGRVFAGASVDGGTEKTNMLTFALDAATGAELWTTTFNDAENRSNYAMGLVYSLALDTVVVAGETYGADGWAAAYVGATGAERWSQQLFVDAGSPRPSIQRFALVRALGISPDGSTAYVGGTRFCGGGFPDCDYQVAALDVADGVVRWGVVHDRRGSSTDTVNALALNADGSILYASGFWGGTGISSDNNVWGQTLGGKDVIGIDATNGEIRWAGFYEGWASSISVSADGRSVFVVGNGVRDRLGMEETAAYDLTAGPLGQGSRYSARLPSPWEDVIGSR